MLYRILAFVIEIGVRQFFQRLSLSGAHVVGEGPLIIAANHPNQAVDSFIIGAIYKRPISFLAKSTLFKNAAFAKLFRALHMVPVYRARDQSDTALNNEMFRDVVAKLEREEAIAIFPEGTSSEQRRLLPLKTGVARIALQAEAATGWNGKIQIQPVGITYLSPRIFQSAVAVTVGEPFSVSQYRERCEADPISAARELTAVIEHRLRDVTVSLATVELQQDVEQVTQLFDDQADMRERMQFIADKAAQFAAVLPAETERVRAEIAALSRTGFELGFFGIGSQALIAQRYPLFKLAWVLLGWFLHLVPYYLTRISVACVVRDPHNLASVKIGFGILWYATWYFMLFYLLLAGGAGAFVASAAVILIMVLGDQTNRYADGALIYVRKLVSRIVTGDRSEASYHRRVDEFLAQRQQLRDRLISLTEAYSNGEQ